MCCPFVCVCVCVIRSHLPGRALAGARVPAGCRWVRAARRPAPPPRTEKTGNQRGSSPGSCRQKRLCQHRITAGLRFLPAAQPVRRTFHPFYSTKQTFCEEIGGMFRRKAGFSKTPNAESFLIVWNNGYCIYRLNKRQTCFFLGFFCGQC